MSGSWSVEYGHGGWLRVTSDVFAGLLYLRFRLDRGRPVLHEIYLDAEDGELSARSLRELPLTQILALAVHDAVDRDWLEVSQKLPGADLALLASHFRTGFGRRARHWVADSFRAQIEGNDSRPERGPKPPPLAEDGAPEPLRPPENGVTDAFLQAVAANHAWAVRNRLAPAPTLADMTGYSPRTVHDWINKARKRGIMPAAKKGSVS